MKNKLYLIGAGPGDPGLITVRGLEILRQADVIIFDYLIDKRILDQARKDAELICCDSLGKKRYSKGLFTSQGKINNLIIKKAKDGKKVARLKNGDSTIFGRYSQELEALLKEDIEFEVVPGVTSASAAASLSGVPLTDRRFASSCVFVTGHEDPNKGSSFINWSALAKSGTIVFYMSVGSLDRITKSLINAGKKQMTPCVIVQDTSLLTQKVLKGTLGDIASKAKREKVNPPAIIIIGDVASLEKEFNWLKKAKRVLFTGISKERFFTKERFFHLPLIKIEPMDDYKEFDNCLRKIDDFDWIIFASRYGVEYFFMRLKDIRRDSRGLNNIKIAAIGNSTSKRLLDFGIFADLVPKKESSDGLVEAFRKIDLRDKKIFMPRSDISDKNLERRLGKLNADVTTGFAYRNVMPEGLPNLELNFFNEIIFTSPSTVKNFKKRYKKLPKGVKVRCIGDVTLKEAGRQGFKAVLL